jgi:hypothetical protein
MKNVRVVRAAQRELALWTLGVVALAALLAMVGLLESPAFSAFSPVFGVLTLVIFVWATLHVLLVARPRAKRARRDEMTLREAMEGAKRIEMTEER